MSSKFVRLFLTKGRSIEEGRTDTPAGNYQRDHGERRFHRFVEERIVRLLRGISWRPPIDACASGFRERNVRLATLALQPSRRQTCHSISRGVAIVVSIVVANDVAEL